VVVQFTWVPETMIVMKNKSKMIESLMRFIYSNLSKALSLSVDLESDRFWRESYLNYLIKISTLK